MIRKLSIIVTLLFAGLSLTGFAIPASRAAEEKGNPWLLWVLVFVVLAAFVAFMVWWSRGRDEEEESELAPPAEPEITSSTRVTEAAVEEPLAERAIEVDIDGAAGTESEEPAPSSKPDDLKKIEGIGPKISSVLQAAGITSFDQLAAADTGRLEQILKDEDPRLLRLAKPTTWPEQAKLAAAEQWEELEKLQDELHGGHRR